MRRAPFVQDALLGTAAPPSSLPMPPPPPFGLGVRSQDPPPPLFRGWLLWRGCLYATPNWSNAHGGGEDETRPSSVLLFSRLDVWRGGGDNELEGRVLLSSSYPPRPFFCLFVCLRRASSFQPFQKPIPCKSNSSPFPVQTLT